jgi:hypothetical protein
VPVGDARQQAHAGKAELLVETKGCRVVGIDIADDLPESRRSADVDQILHQELSDALADVVMVDIEA